jgi:hypothetical protein
MSITSFNGGQRDSARPNSALPGSNQQKITTTTIQDKKLRHDPITCLTAYDYATARLVTRSPRLCWAMKIPCP